MASPDAQREIDFETLNGPGMEWPARSGRPPDDPAVASASTDPLPIEAASAEAASAAQAEAESRAAGAAATMEMAPEAKAKARPARKSAPSPSSPVKGSPGGGDAELTAAMRKTLSAAGWPVRHKRARRMR